MLIIKSPDQNTHPQGKQQGAVLVTSLMLLLVMTIIGVTGMQVTTLEEKMAGNMRDRNLAFQAAEAALRAGENVLTQATLPTFSNNGANGMYTSSSNAAIITNITDTATWAAANTVVYNGGNLANIATAPEYIIQQLPSVDGGGASLDGTSFSTSEFFRVTARGTGGSNTAVAVVQSVYKR
jgi:type IV pilus assembly protein PilX